MRVVIKHTLFAVLFVTLLLAADTATASGAGNGLVDCFSSAGGGYEVCI